MLSSVMRLKEFYPTLKIRLSLVYKKNSLVVGLFNLVKYMEETSLPCDLEDVDSYPY
jgi:hypothetical protein